MGVTAGLSIVQSGKPPDSCRTAKSLEQGPVFQGQAKLGYKMVILGQPNVKVAIACSYMCYHTH